MPCICSTRSLTPHVYIIGFIQELLNDTNELGMVTTRPKKKGQDKQTNRRRKFLKSQYRFNKAALRGDKYQEYFDPSLSTENRLLGIGEMVSLAQVNSDF